MPGAAVTLLGEQGPAGESTTDAEGAYEFASLTSGRYRVAATATGFSPVTSEPVYVGAGSRVSVDVTVRIGPLQQAVVVTASASELPQAQTGAPVTVVDRAAIEALNKPDLLEALRLVPGSQIEQTGARGGATSMFIRGGASSFAKVLIDGIAANDIGGAFDFSQMQTTGVEQIEVLRQANSVIYGSDALTGVISITTRRGRARVPEMTYAVDGGNFGTFNNAASLGGAYKRLDYFSEYSYFTTDNDLPNNRHRNHTYTARVGLALGGSTDLSGTFRQIDGKSGSPNGFSLYGVTDDASSRVAADLRRGRGEVAVDRPLAEHAAIRVNRPDIEFPEPHADRRGLRSIRVRGELPRQRGDHHRGERLFGHRARHPGLRRHLPFHLRQSHDATRAVRPDDVPGSVGYSHLRRGSLRARAGVQRPRRRAECDARQRRAVRGGTGSIGGRTYVGAGVGYEHNAAFGSATTPRLSVAIYLRQPAPGRLGDTKVTFNVGDGIKAPSVFQEQSSLHVLAQGAASGLTTGPIGPERSRSLDVGLEHGFADGQARVRISYFRNGFEDLIEFVSKNVLPQVGIPPEVAQAAPFGAYVNSSSYTAQGLETSAEALIMARLRLMASYTTWTPR